MFTLYSIHDDDDRIVRYSVAKPKDGEPTLPRYDMMSEDIRVVGEFDTLEAAKAAQRRFEFASFPTSLSSASNQQLQAGCSTPVAFRVFSIHDKDGKLLRHSNVKQKGGELTLPRHDALCETVKVVAELATENQAAAAFQRHDREAFPEKYPKYSNYRTLAPSRRELEAASQALLANLPTTPRERQQAFLALDIDEQEARLHAWASTTGKSLKVFQKLLMLNDEQAAYFDNRMIEAAHAELEMNIGFVMVKQALAGNTNTAVIVLNGMNATDLSADVGDINISITRAVKTKDELVPSTTED